MFPRSPEGARRARKILTDVARRWLASDDLANFEIAVGEALANVVESGEGRSLQVTCGRDETGVIAEVGDVGLGFVLGDEDLGVQPEDLSPRGFGIFIIRALSDDVQILNGGTRIRLSKRIRSATEKIAESGQAGYVS